MNKNNLQEAIEDHKLILLTCTYRNEIKTYAQLGRIFQIDPYRLVSLNRIYKYHINDCIKILKTEVTQNEKRKEGMV